LITAGSKRMPLALIKRLVLVLVAAVISATADSAFSAAFSANQAAASDKKRNDGNVSAEQRASLYFESIRRQPSLLLAFLRRMPKGGDLHNHLAGAVWAESYINFAAEDGLCVDRTTLTLLPPPCDSSQGHPAASSAFQEQALYDAMVDAYSMRDFHPVRESGHDHFFNSFGKFLLVTQNHAGDMLAEAVAHAGEDQEQYLELMITADGMAAAQIGAGARAGWDPRNNSDFALARSKLVSAGLNDAVRVARKALDDAEARMRSRLQCGTAQADAGCQVEVRYLYQVLRGLPPEQVFAQIAAGFELAKDDPRVVGLNLVMPEDAYIPMRDFDLHMRMLDYLHAQYPQVHISLHAGELSPQLVPPEGLRFHIRESIERGHAERIGHGVDVMHEDDPIGLLQEMAQRNVLVEICLTSNDGILGIRGAEHPLPMYLRFGVPVALATDDEGVSRSNMTQEYQRAAEGYGLGYPDLKRMARMSVEHSFLPGASLWREAKTFQPVAACAGSGGTMQPSAGCRKYLEENPRANMQWKVEAAFARFEAQF
jgi:adenosine deaminase